MVCGPRHVCSEPPSSYTLNSSPGSGALGLQEQRGAVPLHFTAGDAVLLGK